MHRYFFASTKFPGYQSLGGAYHAGLALACEIASGAAYAHGSKQISGVAAYYSKGYQGPTASGERYDPNKFTCAHRSLPFGTRVRVTDPKSRRTVVVVVNDIDHVFSAQFAVSAIPPRGRLSLNVAPSLELEASHSRPPCASAMVRQMLNPIPIPWSLVVTKG